MGRKRKHREKEDKEQMNRWLERGSGFWTVFKTLSTRLQRLQTLTKPTVVTGSQTVGMKEETK